MKTMDNRLRFIDLFCGCGGMTQGFLNAGFEEIAAFDNWGPARKVYFANFKHEPLKIDLGCVDDILEICKELHPDVIIGGPPCQDFSHAGKRNEDLGRADLTVSFAKIVGAIKPSFFVMENVGRTLKSNRYQIAREIFKEKAGYGLTERILDASLYGVPQKRKRFFVVGELGGNDDSLSKILDSNKSRKPMTVREYFEECLGESPDFQYYYRHPRTYQRRAIYSIDEPSATIRGVNRPMPANYKAHTGDATKQLDTVKPLTTLQRSCIQTFPKGFIFEGSKTDREQMIGNAVPVKLAEHVARSILMYLERKEEKSTSMKAQSKLFKSQ